MLRHVGKQTANKWVWIMKLVLRSCVSFGSLMHTGTLTLSFLTGTQSHFKISSPLNLVTFTSVVAALSDRRRRWKYGKVMKTKWLLNFRSYVQSENCQVTLPENFKHTTALAQLTACTSPYRHCSWQPYRHKIIGAGVINQINYNLAPFSGAEMIQWVSIHKSDSSLVWLLTPVLTC